MLLGLMFLVIILLIYIICLHRMVGSITKQLDKINSLTTNLIIMLPTRNNCLSSLVRNINHLLKINKKNYQELVSNQQQFDRAIHNISHDIRTPLTVASGYTQLLDKNATESDKAIIKKISTHLTDVEKKLNDLLTYNRLLENNVTINYSDVDVTSLMETTIISYYEAFQKSNISLSLEIEKNIQFVTDSDVLKRLIENAVGNILNYGMEESAIRLTRQHDRIIFSFSNKTSHTISDYSKLFNRFYTEDLARVSKNSGLGLYIIKELVTLLEGTVTADGTDRLFKLVIILPIKKKREDCSIS